MSIIWSSPLSDHNRVTASSQFALPVLGDLMWLRLETMPTHTVAGMFEFYEQLLPTRLYACQKTHTDTTGEMMCRLCNEAPENVADVLAGCTALAQNKYVTRHNAALNVLLFEVLQDLGLVDSVPPW